jgi:DNA invertase Pin-like site-specific DNA recombinase
MIESTRSAGSRSRHVGDWTRDDETATLAALRRAAEGAGPRPTVLGYGRQSKSDFDKDGNPKGPSMDQQRDSIERRPEFAGLPIEWYCDADKGGGEADRQRRGDYQALRERIRIGAPGEIGAVAFYYDHRFNRNDVEHFLFMAEMEERRILVFDKEGLVFNADKVSWKIKAIIAQAERERISKTVRDNLAYLKRHGHMLGTIPQGYMRSDGEIVEDPIAAPIIRQIFRLYSTGMYSFQSLSDHLNRLGIKPTRGPGKEHHNRSQAVIFTRDVLKEIVKNPAYLGMVRAGRWRSGDEQWIEGKHPALIDQATWDACQRVRAQQRRGTGNTRTRRSYPLTPVLCCRLCGGPMHGEAKVTNSGQARLLYACRQARSRSAVRPPGSPCTARRIAAPVIEEALRVELGLCLPDGAVQAAYGEELGEAALPRRDPREAAEAAIRRLDEQLKRARRLYEFGELTWDEFLARRSDIQDEQQRLREDMEAGTKPGDMEWCRSQVLDLLAAWEAADADQRKRLLASIFERIEAEARPGGGLLVVGVPVPGWRPFFQGVVDQRETRLELATSSLEV